MDVAARAARLADHRPRAPRLGDGRGRLRGRRHLRGAARHRVHRRRHRPRRVPGRGRRVHARLPAVHRRGHRGGRDRAVDRVRDAARRASARTPRSACCSPGRSRSACSCSAAIQGYVADLFSFLFGNVLAIGPEDLVALLLLGGGVLITIAVLWKELLYATFDPLGAAASGIKVDRLEYLFLALVALTIVVSLQAVGIILVVAMLVTPAATAQLLAVRFTRLMLLAAVIGVVSAVIGLYASYWLDVASGATIVLVQTLLFALALVFGPRGLLGRRRRARGRGGGPSGGRRMTSATTRPSAAAHAGRHLVDAMDRAGHRLTGPRREVAQPRRRARRPLHGRGARRRRARGAASAARRSSGRSTCSPRSASSSGSTCRAATTPTSPASAVASPPRDLHGLRAVDGRRRRRPRRGARAMGARSGFRVTAHRLEIFGLCCRVPGGARGRGRRVRRRSWGGLPLVALAPRDARGGMRPGGRHDPRRSRPGRRHDHHPRRPRPPGRRRPGRASRASCRRAARPTRSIPRPRTCAASSRPTSSSATASASTTGWSGSSQDAGTHARTVALGEDLPGATYLGRRRERARDGQPPPLARRRQRPSVRRADRGRARGGRPGPRRGLPPSRGGLRRDAGRPRCRHRGRAWRRSPSVTAR